MPEHAASAHLGPEGALRVPPASGRPVTWRGGGRRDEHMHATRAGFEGVRSPAPVATHKGTRARSIAEAQLSKTVGSSLLTRLRLHSSGRAVVSAGVIPSEAELPRAVVSADRCWRGDEDGDMSVDSRAWECLIWYA